MCDKLMKQLSFLVEIDKMKSIYRQTFLIDKSRAETDAEHSWHFALMAQTLFEYCEIDGVNIDRVVKMALVHDLVEIYAGDTFAYDTEGNKSKEKLEKDSATKLFSILPIEQGTEYRQLWEEYEATSTPDAIYATAIDKFQPFIANYYSGGQPWLKHGINASMVRERIQFVKDVMPKLSEFIDNVIQDSIEKEYLKN